jgi:hypothetical protein
MPGRSTEVMEGHWRQANDLYEILKAATVRGRQSIGVEINRRARAMEDRKVIDDRAIERHVKLDTGFVVGDPAYNAGKPFHPLRSDNHSRANFEEQAIRRNAASVGGNIENLARSTQAALRAALRDQNNWLAL